MRAVALGLAGLFLTSYALTGADRTTVNDEPQYAADGQLKLPKDYREWIFLSSGLGMIYGPVASANREKNPMFDNVYANRTAYRAFLDSGRWPDKTLLVLEVRASQSKGSINQGGHFQADAMGVEVHVKDERFPGKWAFFSFDNGNDTAKMIPTTESCYSCHEESGAVDTTFVQFYPSLLSVARARNTLKPAGPTAH
jgi:Cytochrome P460